MVSVDNQTSHSDPIVVRAQARVGTVLGTKYCLARVLGVGGMAAVFEGVHVRLGHRVALKVLHHELTLNAGVRDRFLREGYLANSVDHPGVVRVLDDGVADDGSLFLVMELLSGEPLEARWARQGRRLSVPETVTLMLELLGVLVAAHARHILHRDLKIENLFHASDGSLRVMDFGIAKQRATGGTTTLTADGEVFGTPWYMAPEQALGTRDVDARSDLWAVGATAFTLLTGRYVHGNGDETVQQALVLASTRHAPPLRSVGPQIPMSVAAVFDRALAFRREDRWPSAEAMRDALAAAQDSMIRASLHSDDEEHELVRTRVTSAPPAMTPPAGPRTSHAEQTLPMQTVPVANTVGGLASDSGHRHYPRRVAQALRGFASTIVRWVQGVHPLSRVYSTLRRLGSTVAAITASSTLGYRRRAAVAAMIGLAAAASFATIALFAVRATSRCLSSSASVLGTSSAAIVPSSSMTEPREPAAPSTPPEIPSTTTWAPPVMGSPIATPTRPAIAPTLSRPQQTPKPPRPRRDPLAP